MSTEHWRWKAIGTLFFDDGDRVSVAFDRRCDGPPTGILGDLIAVLDLQTTWELDRCVIELRAYQDDTLPAVMAEAAPVAESMPRASARRPSEGAR